MTYIRFNDDNLAKRSLANVSNARKKIRSIFDKGINSLNGNKNDASNSNLLLYFQLFIDCFDLKAIKILSILDSVKYTINIK